MTGSWDEPLPRLLTTTEQLAELRKHKELALEYEDWPTLRTLRDEEQVLLEKQALEFKPNTRGS